VILGEAPDTQSQSLVVAAVAELIHAGDFNFAAVPALCLEIAFGTKASTCCGFEFGPSPARQLKPKLIKYGV
jgi:hypothetical protein